MRKNVNIETIEGYVYQHNLQIRTVERADSPNKGTSYISGTLDVATDESCTNVLQVHYTYVAEVYKSGKQNISYTNLKRIIDTGKTVVDNGIAEATKVRLTPSLALNEFYPEGSEEVVSQMRNEGGFVTIISEFGPGKRAYFEFDVVLTGFALHEANETNNGVAYGELRGVAFDFRNAILPATFIIRGDSADGVKGLNYFDSLNLSATNPLYTKIKGDIVSAVVTIEKVSESAFGEAFVDTVTRRVKEWRVTWAAPTPFEFGEEGVLTVEELKKATEDRSIYLAEEKKRAEEYRASRHAAAASTSSFIKDEGFNF